MTKEKENIWLKSAVIGSLWASVEIIMGSFFHNLQLPFAGTLLAVFTVVFIVAVMQIWKQSGIIWRAGLICALMKSISPSAVILGPMTGIFFEAVLLELFIFIFGRNIFGYIIAGAIAVLSALLHKLLTLLIIYGWDSVKILANLYNYAMKQLNIENINPLDALIILTSIYIILGVFASVAGYLIGQKAKQKQKALSIDDKIDFSQADSFFGLNKEQKFSVYLLLLNIVLVISGMILINYFGLIYGSIFAIGYIIFNSIRYKNAFRQFKRPFLWLQLVILSILASLFYTKSETSLFNIDGLFIGLNMSVRAIIVILGFSSISVELRNPIVKTVLYKKGFSQLYNALGLAFSSLPSIISKVSKPKQIFKKPFKTIIEILLYMDSLLSVFTKRNTNKITIITGDKHSGKTTKLKEIVLELISEAKKCEGFYALGDFKENKRNSFILQDINNKKEILFMSSEQNFNYKKIGKFYINPKALEFGKKILKNSVISDTEYIIIDEIGQLEINGDAWAENLSEIIKTNKKLIITVRTELLEKIIAKFRISDYKLIKL